MIRAAATERHIVHGDVAALSCTGLLSPALSEIRVHQIAPSSAA
jgi:hypothetical protein